MPGPEARELPGDLSFDILHLKEEYLQELIAALEDSTIDVSNENELIRIYSE
jgi:hypothetical protein